MSTLSLLLFKTMLEVLTKAIRQEKEIKTIQIERWEVKLSLATGDLMLYTENPKEFKHNKTIRTSEQVKQGCRMQVQHIKNQLHFYHMKIIVFNSICKEFFKYLGINLTKAVQGMYTKNYKKHC